ncbi:hypothetical protein, partial [Escherichia coli]|uniref:hypothetical protein n=1 Tax=Escherichia coli TaxID=562 RepID=UPI001CDA7785
IDLFIVLIFVVRSGLIKLPSSNEERLRGYYFSLRYSCFPLQYFFAFLYTFIPVIPDQKTSNPHNKTRFVTDVTN